MYPNCKAKKKKKEEKKRRRRRRIIFFNFANMLSQLELLLYISSTLEATTRSKGKCSTHHMDSYIAGLTHFYHSYHYTINTAQLLYFHFIFVRLLFLSDILLIRLVRQVVLIYWNATPSLYCCLLVHNWAGSGI